MERPPRTLEEKKRRDAREQFLAKREARANADPPETLEKLQGSMLTLQPGQLYRSPSHIANAGLGLFCARPLAKGEYITWYDGAYVTREEYEQIKKKDPDYRSYTQTVDNMATIIVGNYRRANNNNQELIKIPYDLLEQFYYGRGAFQFMNGGRSFANKEVNVGGITLKDRLRAGPRDKLLFPEERDKLARKYPFGVLYVAMALEDIPADTELIMKYGDTYMDEIEQEGTGDDSEQDQPNKTQPEDPVSVVKPSSSSSSSKPKKKKKKTTPTLPLHTMDFEPFVISTVELKQAQYVATLAQVAMAAGVNPKQMGCVLSTPLLSWIPPDNLLGKEFHPDGLLQAFQDGEAYWYEHEVLRSKDSADISFVLENDPLYQGHTDRLQRLRHLWSRGFAITHRGVVVVNWYRQHDQWLRAVLLAMRILYMTKENRPYYKDILLHRQGRHEYLKDMLCTLQEWTDYWLPYHALSEEDMVPDQDYPEHKELPYATQQAQGPAKQVARLLDETLGKTRAADRGMPKKFYLLNGLPGTEEIQGLMVPLLETTLNTILRALERTMRHNSSEVVAWCGRKNGSKALIRLNRKDRLFVFELLQTDLGSVGQPRPLLLLPQLTDQWAEAVKLRANGANNTLGIGLAYRTWYHQQPLRFRNAAQLQLLLLHGLARVLAQGHPKEAPESYSAWRKYFPFSHVDVAKDVFPDESPYVYQALQFLLNLAERAGVLDKNFTRAYAVIFKKGIQWDQPWLSSNDFQRGDALRELENYFLSTELEVNFLSLEDMQEHLAQKRGMKRVITMQEVITLTPNLSELYLS